jgi:thiamine transporter ThiT
MMNFLCGPNGFLTAGVAVGATAGVIWGTVDLRFRENYLLGKMLVLFGAVIGAALVGILSIFITPAC